MNKIFDYIFLGLVAIGLILTLIVTPVIRAREYHITEKYNALMRFELQCERNNKPYCQEVIHIMKQELDIEYP